MRDHNLYHYAELTKVTLIIIITPYYLELCFSTKIMMIQEAYLQVRSKFEQHSPPAPLPEKCKLYHEKIL